MLEVGCLVVIVVPFLRDAIVVLRFTVKFVAVTGFLVVFITVDVSVFDGFGVVTGRLDGFTVVFLSDVTDVRLNACVGTGFLVEFDGFVGFLVLLDVAGSFVVVFAVVADPTVELSSLES